MAVDATARAATVEPGAQGRRGAAFAVVLVSWNNRTYLEPCLEALYAARLSHGFEVVVVDNGSTDGTQDMLRARYAAVQLIQNDGNVGLSRACNQGIAATHAPYILLLNDDTVVNGPGLDALVSFLDTHPESAAAGGTLLNDDGSFQSGFNPFPSMLEDLVIACGVGERLRDRFAEHRSRHVGQRIGWLGSACLLLRRAALDRVGLLDEEYFIYGDEVDLQYRLVGAGWRVDYLPHVTTIHYGGRSLDRWRRRRMVYRGKMLFYRKHYGAVRELLLRAAIGVLTTLKVGVWCLAWPLPPLRTRAERELASNREVLRLCAKLE